MDWQVVGAVVGAILGTGGLVSAVVAMRKVGPEARAIGVGTQKTIMDMAEQLLTRIEREREECLLQLAGHEARIRYLEELLRTGGLEYNGPR